ncbi:MAG: hypothetical protein HYU66_07710 [Armatimonadetes bacterium]|nr:hypothetical protein [Armatimonadota bacterium]
MVRAPATGPPPEPLRRPDAAPLPAPDFAFARRRLLLALAAYALMAVLLTWPLAAHFTTHRAGRGLDDACVFLGNLQRFAECVRQGVSPLSTDRLFWPERVSVLHHTMHWFNCALALPLLAVCSLTVTYNLIYLATFVACAGSLYFLAAAVVRDRRAAWVAGLAFAFSPFLVARSLEHPNLFSAQFLPLLALAVYAAVVTGKARYALWGGLCYALGGLCDWYDLVFGLVIAALIPVGAHLAAPAEERTHLPRRLLLAGLAPVLGAVLLSPLLVPMLREQSQSRFAAAPRFEVSHYKADLLDFVKPSPLHPVTRQVVRWRGVEWVVTPGLTVLLLAWLGWRRAERASRPWAAAATAGLVLACGPQLWIGGIRGAPPAALVLLGGPPGSAFRPPLTAAPLFDVARDGVASPRWLCHGSTEVRLPFDWLPTVLPLLRPFRAPARFAVVGLLAVAVLAAFGLARVRVGRPWAVPVAALAVLGEFVVVPLPLVSMAADPFYEQLGRDPGDYAVLEAPVDLDYRAASYYQTVHRKKLLYATLSRYPPSAVRYLRSNPLLGLLGLGAGDEAHPAQHGLRAEQVTPAVRIGAGAPGLASLRQVGVRYVVVHKDMLLPGSWDWAKSWLAGELGLPLAYEDAELGAFEVSPAATPPAPSRASPARGEAGPPLSRR